MSKKLNILFIVLAVVCVSVTLCAAADQWADVKNAGVIRFGVSSDYIPFVYMDGTTLDGLDIALVKEMGRRLGLDVQPVDIAFDGLVDAVLIGQVDLIGGGFAITDDRAKALDYTNAYYQAGGVVLSRAGETVAESSIRTSKVGVQKGTSFEQWVASNLLMGGKVSPVNVYTYSKIDDVINALVNGNIDLAIIDADVYRSEYSHDSKLALVTDDVVNEKYAYAAAKGSTLIPQLNTVMREMFKDGTAQKIADEYFSKDFSDRIAPSITRPAQAVAPEEPEPVDLIQNREVTLPEVLADNPANCRNGMMFISDVSIPDGTKLLPNMNATKTWNIQNTGTCTWDSTYSFNYVKGSVFGPTTVKIDKLVAPGDYYQVSADFTTPAANGEYTAFWQMRNGAGVGFGQTIWYDFIVTESGSSDQRVSQGTPKILMWYPDYYATDEGRCPKTYYQVTDAYKVEFYINNQFIDSSENLSGYTYLCPPKKMGVYTIAIVAVGENTLSTAYTFTDATQYPDPRVGVSADWPVR